MTTEHRRAPRRRVVSVDRVGAWGKFQYLHTLDCGHTESRKRAARTEEITCVLCLRTDGREEELRGLFSPQPTPLSSYDDGPSLVDEELRVEKIRATLAARFNVPIDAIGLSVEDVAGSLVVRNCVIYLSAADVTRIVTPR
jgi:hypothetical protein